MFVLDFITANILRNPPVLLGLIAGLGLSLQGKAFTDIVKGMLLAAFGMIILDTGVGMLVGTIAPINGAFQSLSAGAGAVEGLNDVTFTQLHGGEVGLAMLVALILHLLIARFSPFKIIFLTGHMIWWFPFIFVAAGVEAGLSGWLLVLISAAFSALYWSIMPFVLRKYVWAVTDDQGFTLGHPTGILSLVSGFVASKVGNKAKSTEDFKVPAALSFFREASIIGAIVIFVLWIVVGIIIKSLVAGNLVMESINQGLRFGAGLLVMLTGVRMLISQIVPAFKGISDKLVPNAIPALDCPVIFNYRPNAVIIGFIVAMVVSTILVLVCNTLNVFGVMLIPLVITSFFECGSAAVIGEGQGGLRGCIIGTICAAIVMVVIVGISAIVYSGTIQNWMLIFGGNDFSLFGPIARVIGGLFGFAR
ncbi:MAG: PTS ascorbate transporter subunit IIC [Treponema sp.]|jgi:PTS system ascorbate-specific IIC component|nr:PTS ascorbate transporter subunit IIC [Treponema sp.]